jgi:hypothetical protein
MKHLWEIDHPYYCNKGNYFARESVCSEYKSWRDFLAANEDADFDMNLVFRFDWEEDEGSYTGDDNYRNGLLAIFWMGQRKGLYRYSTIEVCRADENSVIAFLQPRWEHMRKLWEPIPDNPTQQLLAAANAVIERWDSPLWKHQEHTGKFIDELRKAVARFDEARQK